ncbi:MAG: enolase C-terminal domain-like protein [Candidatus Paceibacterota bacterium]
MATIKSLQAKEILDSMGNPTIHVDLQLDSGELVETSVPNGIRQYPSEAKVLFDQDPEHMAGRGVRKAVNLINKTIAPQLIGQNPQDQTGIDQLLLQLDNTPDKTQVGANTLIAVSQAVMKAGALASSLPLYQYLINQYQLTDHVALPVCLYGLVNGGQYGSGNLDFQEFLVIPASHVDYRVSLEIESALRDALQKILKDQKANYSTGELGGFTPFLQKNTDVFEFIIEAARKTSYILARDFFFGIDAGAEQLLDKGKYLIKDKATSYSEKELLEYYQDLQKQYNLTYFEDPFVAKDTNSWQAFTADLGQTTRIASDIMTATDHKLVTQAIQNKTSNTLVVKPSQIGTLTETLEAVRIARTAGWSIVVSQRTGETNDDFLADFAVGIGAEFVKFGPTNRGEAVAKYNRLADIYLALEKIIREGTDMQNNQPTNPVSEPTNPVSEPTASNQAPADPAGEPTGQTTPVPTMPTDATPTNSGIPSNQSSIPQPSSAPNELTGNQGIAEEVTLGQVPTAPTTAPTATPTVPATPTPVAPTNSAPLNPAVEPAPVASPDSLPTEIPQMPAPTEAPMNTPPTAAPMVAPEPKPTEEKPAVDSPANKQEETAQPVAVTKPVTADKPLEAEVQKTIDSTLQEIGAATQPTAQPTTPTVPAQAPTE